MSLLLFVVVHYPMRHCSVRRKLFMAFASTYGTIAIAIGASPATHDVSF
ncbi:MAG: hypothetical protein H6797_03795 [Candidatus Nomurabacteria bacterium]|nr:MAG: hypothetical protein H6797_03795 [Candidatus Nomurabacteria bacterium]